MRIRPSTFALADLDKVVWAQGKGRDSWAEGLEPATEAWLLWDEDLGWAWWTAVDEDPPYPVAAYATWEVP